MEHSELSSTRHLANYLNATEEFILRAIGEEYWINDSSTNQIEILLEAGLESESDVTEYIRFNANPMEINKIYLRKKSKKGDLRVVYSPNIFGLASTLKILNNKLSDIYQAKECVHGFVRGKSIRTNAKQHLGKKYILSIDIKEFFDSIDSEMIKCSLIKLGFIPDVADWITKITTVNGRLVQGFHTSPIIANIVSQEMDDEFLGICQQDITYTRYADDLYFSSDIKLPDVSIFENVLHKFSFQINKEKTSLMKRGRSQYVTGLTVFDNKIPRIPKSIKRRIRLEVHHICKHGYQKHAIRQLLNAGINMTRDEFSTELGQHIIEIQHRLFGWLHYINSIEPIFADAQIRKLLLAKKYISFEPR